MTDKRLVLVSWKDAQSIRSEGRWVEPDDVDGLEPWLCHSVGWVRKHTPDFITLYAHDAGDCIGGDLCIPWVCVVSVKELRAVE
jgi:hypothetical protein